MQMLRLKSLEELQKLGVTTSSDLCSSTKQAKGSLRASSMNKTEARYACELELKKQAGMILDYWYESIKLKIAEDKCWYTPDFLVLNNDLTLELHEVKGTQKIFWDDAKVKTKVCATRYPFKLFVVFPEGQGWKKVQM